jgi:shikimate O-hydroxycinnamoyltransferase
MAQVVAAESCLVTPSSETPTRALCLSQLDLLKSNRGHTPLLHFYRNSGGATDFFDVRRLKAALGRALVAFYPLAGRIDVDSDGRLQINCDGQGALFVVAYSSHLTVDHLSDFKPSPELRRLLVPRLDSAEAARIVCATQVTFFKCGGVAIGTALHHLAQDGNGASHFFQTWSAFSRDEKGAVVDLPCHDRALLSAEGGA